MSFCSLSAGATKLTSSVWHATTPKEKLNQFHCKCHELIFLPLNCWSLFYHQQSSLLQKIVLENKGLTLFCHQSTFITKTFSLTKPSHGFKKKAFSLSPLVLAPELTSLGWVIAIDTRELWIMFLVNRAKDLGKNWLWGGNQRNEYLRHFCLINTSVSSSLLSEKMRPWLRSWN